MKLSFKLSTRRGVLDRSVGEELRDSASRQPPLERSGHRLVFDEFTSNLTGFRPLDGSQRVPPELI